MIDSLPEIRIVHLRVRYRLRDPLPRAVFQGSLWRGAFGVALKEALCLYERPLEHLCPECILYTHCSYPPLFEPRVPAELSAGGSDDAPRPFVLQPPVGATRPLKPGEEVEIGLLLMGPALRDLPLLVRVMAHLGERGLGERQARAALVRVEALNLERRVEVWPRKAPDALPLIDREALLRRAEVLPEQLVLDFITPTRIKREGRLLVTPDAESVTRALLRRLISLAVLYGEPWYPPAQDLIATAAVLGGRAETNWEGASHVSTRQQQRIPLDGFTGQLHLDHVPLDLRALLLLGSLAHVGKMATYGHGWYEVKGV
ncbi:MAG: CRISPR system precrRNA processing endoribonuclease RAMP protein Cas6 [Ardenticatenaceae bacterium]